MRLLHIRPKLDQERRLAIYEHVAGISTPTLSFYVMVAISTTIAGYGLLANSTAVVIGAMLVAPLMGPIFGIALGLSAGDRGLLERASRSEVLGVVLAVALGFLIGSMPLRGDYGTEILARTQPTLYDIIIALASGLAGAFAMTDRRISAALPGVAIATAIVPPLTTCGLCLAAGRLDWALGAFLLFLANFLAIEIAAALIFTLYGMAQAQEDVPLSLWAFIRRFRSSLGLLAAIAVFMTHTLVNVIAERRLSAAVRASLAGELGSSIGAHLSELRLSRRRAAVDVTAVVLSPQEFGPEQVAGMEDVLCERIDPRIRLVVRSVISRDANRAGPVFLPDSERQRRAGAAEEMRFLTTASDVLRDWLQGIAGARLADLRRAEDDGETKITAVVHTPRDVTPAEVAQVQDALSEALGTPVRVVVRSVITRDADAQRYLYEVRKDVAPLAGWALNFHRRLQGALRGQLAGQVEGALLQEVRYAHRGGRLLVLAVAKTPRSFTPAQTKAVEDALRRYVEPTTDLVLRSVVGSETAASGYLLGFDESRLSGSR